MTGSVFVCRLIIPYGRDKANYWVYDAPKKVKYQFPMGKVKKKIKEILSKYFGINSLWER